MTIIEFLGRLRWIDGSPLLPRVEPYRRSLFERFFAIGQDGRPVHNLGLFGRAKKNFKTCDLVLACLYALLTDSPGGSQVFLVANDQGQAADDLKLASRLLKANPQIASLLRAKANLIERKDGDGFIEVLPAQDAIGAHGKTYRLLGVDEIHGYRNWDLLEALASDPTRRDTQLWITSYASLFHKPGAPLFDLFAQAKRGDDARMLFSWYAADHCTDPEFASKSPEEMANPSLTSWGNPEYLAQQQRRLPAHKYRRLHLNLPGLPEGSAFQPEPVFNAIERGIPVRRPELPLVYGAYVDMSGGSADDAVLAVGHVDAMGRAVLDVLIDQGQRPPFNPNAAVTRFVRVLQEYGITRVTGDRYAGLTFKHQFECAGVGYDESEQTTSEIYEAFEPLLNASRVVLLDVPTLEQQLLGLAWRGGRIDHQPGEHDDFATAAAGVAVKLLGASEFAPSLDDGAAYPLFY